jgi:hypothetical protein
MIRVYFIGLFILITAIIANVIAAKLQLKSWYALLDGLANSSSLSDLLTLKDSLWLFILYPLILGLGAVVANLLYLKICSS